MGGGIRWKESVDATEFLFKKKDCPWIGYRAVQEIKRSLQEVKNFRDGVEGFAALVDQFREIGGSRSFEPGLADTRERGDQRNFA